MWLVNINTVFDKRLNEIDVGIPEVKDAEYINILCMSLIFIKAE